MKDIIREINKRDLHIVTLTETKRKGSGLEECGNFVHIYTGVPKEERAAKGVSMLIHKTLKNKITNWEAVNDRIISVNLNHRGHKITAIGIYAPTNDADATVKDDFFGCLDDILTSTGNQREVILMGDLNSRVGKKNNNLIVGQFGEDTLNDNGERLVSICQQHSLKIMNGFFQHKDIHKFTWHQETRQLRSIIDYIIMRQNSKLMCQDVRVLRGSECGSDHFLIRGKIKVPFNKATTSNVNTSTIVSTTKSQRYRIELFKEQSIKMLYQSRLNQKLDEDLLSSPTIDLYSHLVTSVENAAMEALGTYGEGVKKISEDWSDELEEQKIKKQKLFQKWLSTGSPDDREAYRRELTTFKRLHNIEKNKSWDRKCSEINSHIGGSRSSEAWKVIDTLRSNRVTKVNLPIINITNWRTHYERELREERPIYATLSPKPYRAEGTYVEITIARVSKALNSLKNNKASGPEGIPAELLKYGSHKFKWMLSVLMTRYINNEVAIPESWKSGWITPIHKKGRKDVCSNYRCISVTSSFGRVYSKILKQLIDEEYGPSELEEQGGFRAGRSCIDNIFPLTQIIEKKLATNNDQTHLLFVDLTKAYDTVPIKKLWEAMEKTSVNVTVIKAIQQLYMGATSQIKIGQSLSEPFLITKGLRQGCCLSPTLFKIYLDQALLEWRRKCRGMGIPLSEDYTLYTLHFADDQVLIAHDREDLEYMARKLIEMYDQWGLQVNFEKTKYMCVGGPTKDLILDNNQKIVGCEEYTYLGVKIDSHGRCEKEIQSRITKGKKIIGALNPILWSKNITHKTKKLIYSSILESVILYGSEVWQINQQQERKLLATEMDFWRRSARVSRLDHIRNERIREMMNVETDMVQQIQHKQLQWYGHVERMQDERIPKMVMKWCPRERRRRGRPKTTWMQGIRKAMSARDLNDGDWNDRQRWRVETGRRRRTL